MSESSAIEDPKDSPCGNSLEIEDIQIKQEDISMDTDTIEDSNQTEGVNSEGDNVDNFNKDEEIVADEDSAFDEPKPNTESTKDIVKIPRGRKRTKTNRSDRSRNRSSASYSSEFSGEMKPPVKRNGIVFEVGAKLRARDNSQKWYDAKIIDVDEDRSKIKIHFDRWNSRYDQWIHMDSKDLKAFSPERLSKNFATYKVGDEVLAKWRDHQMYPAKVEKVFDNGTFLVIFYDGFVSKMHTVNMQPLPPKCLGKLKFPTMEEVKKSKRSSTGNIFTSFFLNSSLSPGSSDQTPVEKLTKDLSDIWEILKISPPASAISEALEKKAVKEFIIEEDHNHYKCTETGCNKSFRKATFLESHLKHYHDINYTSPTAHVSRKRSLEPQEKIEPVAKKKVYIQNTEHHAKVEKKPSLGSPVSKPQPQQSHQEASRSEEKRVYRKYIAKPSPTILPMRSSTRRVSLPAKFASEEICLTQPLGRDRTISSSETTGFIEKKVSLKKERTHKDSSEIRRFKKDHSSAHHSTSKTEKYSRERSISREKKASESDKGLKKSSLLSKQDDTKNDVDLVTKGIAFAKKMSLEQFPDPDRIEKMITIASSSKKSSMTVGRSGMIQLTSTALHRQKSRKVDTEKGSQSLKLKIKTPPTETPKITEVSKSAALKQPILSSVLSAPPLNHQPAPVATVSSTPVKDLPSAETPSVDTKKESSKPVNSLTAVAMSLSEILSSSFDNSKSDSKSEGEVKTISTPSKIMEVSPSNVPGHVMCTRRKEAILEKEKATQMIGGHVMCTRKKSEKLAAVEEKFKQKILSPGKAESSIHITPPNSPPSVKRRRVFSAPRSGTKNDVPDDTKDLERTIKVEQPDTQDSGSQEEESADKTIVEEVVHCVCGCWEEEGLMMQCEICLTWQHGSCFNIEEEKNVPDEYVCYACLNPKGLREGHEYKYDQSWFRKGEMPNYSFIPHQAPPSNCENVQATHNYVASLHTIVATLRSLNHKINIVSAESHPDLSLFHKSYIEESDEAETDDKFQEAKIEDQEPTISSSQEDVGKHKLTSQNLVTFDHSYYSPEVDILDLDAMPLIIDDDFKSDTSKDGDTAVDKCRGSVNVKEIVDDILSVERPKLQMDVIDAISSSTESANEAIDENGYSAVMNKSKETTLSTDEDSGLNSLESRPKNSANKVTKLLSESINFKNRNLKPIVEVQDMDSTPSFTDHSVRTKDNYAAETSFCKPVSSTSNFFSGLNEAGELVLPLTSEKKDLKEDLLSDFNFNAKCKRNLMDHIKTTLYELEPELDRVEELVEALEKEEFQRQNTNDMASRMPQRGVRVPNYRRLKRLRKDLLTVQRMANFQVQKPTNA